MLFWNTVYMLMFMFRLSCPVNKCCSNSKLNSGSIQNLTHVRWNFAEMILAKTALALLAACEKSALFLITSTYILSILSSRLRNQSTVFDLIQPAFSWSIVIFLKIWFQSQLLSMTVLSETYVTNIHSFGPLSAVLC